MSYLTTEKKKEFFKQYGGSETNTGSTEAKVALFTFRIKNLTEHLKKHKKDFSTTKALTTLVGKRRKLLKYLQRTNLDSYRSLVEELNLRK